MDSKWLDRLEEQVQVEYEERMNAIKVLRGVAVTDADAEPSSGPAIVTERRVRLSLKGLSAAEKKQRRKDYMKAYLARKRDGADRRKDGGDNKGLSKSVFDKFLVKGPVAQGGTGEDE